MSLFVCDIESDGPIPGPYSMINFGIVKVEPSLEIFYYGETKPISKDWIPEALAISGVSRETHETFNSPEFTMTAVRKWIIENNTKGRPIFISDNNGYDFAFFNYYFHTFIDKSVPFNDRNPFGWSSRRISDLYCGMMKDSRAAWKHLRKTKHTHDPVQDSLGNAEVILEMKRMGLKIDLR